MAGRQGRVAAAWFEAAPLSSPNTLLHTRLDPTTLTWSSPAVVDTITQGIPMPLMFAAAPDGVGVAAWNVTQSDTDNGYWAASTTQGTWLPRQPLDPSRPAWVTDAAVSSQREIVLAGYRFVPPTTTSDIVLRRTSALR